MIKKLILTVFIIAIILAAYLKLTQKRVMPSGISESQARIIAQKSCIKGGEALGPGTYNPNSKTWWFDANLNATRPGCNPACVVSEVTGKAEINWRCTGLIVPTGATTPSVITNL